MKDDVKNAGPRDAIIILEWTEIIARPPQPLILLNAELR